MIRPSLKTIIAAGVLAAALLAVWAAAWLRDLGRESVDLVASGERRPTQPSLPAAAPPKRPRKRLPDRLKLPAPSRGPGTSPASAAPAPGAPPVVKADELAVRQVLEPLLARRPSTRIGYVRCLAAGAWPRATSSETGQGRGPLDVPTRNPDQSVCRAQLRASARDDLIGLLKDASGSYRGHLAATDIREHLDAYRGRWWESDIQVDTEDAHAVPHP